MNFFYLSIISFVVSIVLWTVNCFKPNKWLALGGAVLNSISAGSLLYFISLFITDFITLTNIVLSRTTM